MKNDPFLSIVVRTYNSAETLENCLSAIKSSTEQNFELIVVDDCSWDSSVEIARKFTSNVFCFSQNQGMSIARQVGMQAAKGEVIVCIDSDVIINTDSLQEIKDFFKKNSDVSAVTGILSKVHPNRNFFSQYKNLYMHFIFKDLNREITFLYGSINAVRREVIDLFEPDFSSYGEDTYYGMCLTSHQKRIYFMRNLEVVHLKKFDFAKFVKNDFFIPFFWARLVFKFGGWKQLGKKKSGFAHASKKQIACIILAPMIMFLAVIRLFIPFSGWVLAIPIFLWVVFVWRFIGFLFQERGLKFGTVGFLNTFFDHLVMFSGIVLGFANALFCKKQKAARSI